MGPRPTISVIVPTYNRRERLQRMLQALDAAAGRASLEVVVVVDGATDGTAAMLASLQPRYPLVVIEQANTGPAAARNRAILAAHGDVLLFLDDDVIPMEGLVEKHAAVHADHPLAVVIGPMLAPPELHMAPWLLWEAVMLQKQYDAMLAGVYPATPRQFYTANASVRRELALAAGLFDEAFTRAEDVEFAYRVADLGGTFRFLPDAYVLHEPDRSFASWLRVPYEYGRFAVLMERSRGRNDVQRAYREWDARHPLSKLLTRWCVGHRWRFRAAVGALERAVTWSGSRTNSIQRVQLLLCSALFNLQFWQGIAETSKLGTNVWKGLDVQPG